MPDTTTPPLIWAELPEPFDPRWSRLPGLDIEGRALSIDPSAHFYRYERPAWLLCDWAAVRDELLPVTETADQALEQIVLDYIREHGARRRTRPRCWPPRGTCTAASSATSCCRWPGWTALAPASSG